MFLSYIFCRTRGAGGNFAQGHRDIKICIPFLLSGGGWGKFRPGLGRLANRDGEFGVSKCVCIKQARNVELFYTTYYSIGDTWKTLAQKQDIEKATKCTCLGRKGRVVSVAQVMGRHKDVRRGAQPRRAAPGGHRRRHQHPHGRRGQPGHGTFPLRVGGVRLPKGRSMREGGHDPHASRVPAQGGHLPNQRTPHAVVPTGKRLGPGYGAPTGRPVGPPPGPPNPNRPPQRHGEGGGTHPLQPHEGPPTPIRPRRRARLALPLDHSDSRAGQPFPGSLVGPRRAAHLRVDACGGRGQNVPPPPHSTRVPGTGGGTPATLQDGAGPARPGEGPARARDAATSSRTPV